MLIHRKWIIYPGNSKYICWTQTASKPWGYLSWLPATYYGTKETYPGISTKLKSQRRTSVLFDGFPFPTLITGEVAWLILLS